MGEFGPPSPPALLAGVILSELVLRDGQAAGRGLAGVPMADKALSYPPATAHGRIRRLLWNFPLSQFGRARLLNPGLRPQTLLRTSTLHISGGPNLIMAPDTPLQEVSRAKKAEREERLARRPEWRLRTSVPPGLTDVSALPTSQLMPREYEIVHLDATALADAIRARRYTAVEVLEAFCHVATIAQDLTNCLTEVLFEEGLRRARELDRHLAETGEVVGPMHGVPVSIKDHILVKGHDTATGYAAWAFRMVAAKDAVVVDVLRKAGAVIYVKTANPQTLLVRRAAAHARERD